MLETLAHIDYAIFTFVNGTIANPVTDLIMPVITNDWLLRVLYGVAMILCLWKGNAKIRWMVLFSAVVLLLSDQISANVLKDWIERPRPCHTHDTVRLLVGCGGGYSMPSAHAANTFGQAVLYSFHFRRLAPSLYIFAAIVAISRIFVGVHYPGDVLVGAVVGATAGLVMAFAFREFEARVLRKVKKTEGSDGFQN